jgi:hypothetical protein
MPEANERRRFSTRKEMLSLLPQGAVVAEIGVFEGRFSEEILEACAPKELVLIDIWAPGPMTSGDVDGNNIQEYIGEQLELATRDRMRHRSQVKIIKSPSSILATFPANSFDAVYIDGDHSYNGAMLDLVNSARVVKDGGWIMGHDYDHNPEKSATRHDFGVKEAVDVFCRAYGQKIAAVGMDGCVSFAIHLQKRDAWGALRFHVAPLWLRTRGICRRILRGLSRRTRRIVGMPLM